MDEWSAERYRRPQAGLDRRLRQSWPQTGDPEWCVPGSAGTRRTCWTRYTASVQPGVDMSPSSFVSGPGGFDVETFLEDGVTVVACQGELDVASASTLDA